MNISFACSITGGRAVSKMVVGNPHPNLTVRSYQAMAEAADLARNFASNPRLAL